MAAIITARYRAAMVVVLFFCGLLLTLVGIALTMISGRRAERRRHLIRAISTVVLLAATILLAYRLGQAYDFPEREMGIHMWFSRSSALLVPLVAVSGALLWRNPKWRGTHRVLVYLFVVAAIGAVVTGVWSFSLAVPR